MKPKTTTRLIIITLLDPESYKHTQLIDLTSGWNIWSTYISPEDGDMEAVFSNIINDVIIVKDGNGNVYWPEYVLNSIGVLTWGEGYQTKMSSYNSLNISGSLIPYDYGFFLDGRLFHLLKQL